VIDIPELSGARDFDTYQVDLRRRRALDQGDFMKTFRFAAVFFALAASVQAQTIHNAPQGVAAYADPSEWPFLSGQCHWAPSNNPVPEGNPSPTLGHTHVEVNAPIWAELGATTVTMPITVRLFHTSGRIVSVWAEHSNDVIWDATGTTDLPDMTGDPNGLKTWTGHVTYDPLLDKKDGYGPAPVHGWFGLRFFARTRFDNGDLMVYTLLTVPFYSTINPLAPERVLGGIEGIDLRASCTPFTTRDTPAGSNGSGISQVRDQSLPILAPISTPMLVKSSTYNYGRNGVPPSTYELFLDSDLHMNVPGTPLVQSDLNRDDAGTDNADTIDPSTLAASKPPMGFAPNEHRLSFTWKNGSGPLGGQNGAGTTVQPNETLVTLLVVKVKTAPGVVPSFSFPPPLIFNPATAPPPPASSMMAVPGRPVSTTPSK